MKRRLFLASSSPRRQEILLEAGIPFSCIPNRLSVEPDRPSGISALQWVQTLAQKKAEASANGVQGLVCGSDTMVVLNDQDFGKPKDTTEAAHFLRQLSGQTHQVLSGICLVDTISGQTRCGVDTAEIRFNVLSDDQIQTYIQTYQVLDKAGSYGIQHKDAGIIQAIEGNYHTVMGLPLEPLCVLLANYDILKEQ